MRPITLKYILQDGKTLPGMKLQVTHNNYQFLTLDELTFDQLDCVEIIGGNKLYYNSNA
jgi:hypothetical protein